jgi:hypothetical protein
MVLGLAQPLTEMSTRNHPEGEGQSASKADISIICELPRKCTSLDVSQPHEPPPLPFYPLQGKFCEPQSQYGICGVAKNLALATSSILAIQDHATKST